MNCADLETLLCDYVDATLDAGRRTEVERHLAGCEACAETARDIQAALGFIERVADVEPPPELITRLLFEIPTRPNHVEKRPSWRSVLGRWFEPVLQPRLAMGMAMTILSFAMLGRFAGIQPRQLKPADLQPARIWLALEDKVQRGWDQAVKYYESLRFVYEIQSRLREWTEQDETGVKNTAQPEGATEPESPAGGKEKQ